MTTSRTHETEQGTARPLLPDLRTRADIDALLQHFYTDVIHDDLLRHIFIDVAQMALVQHLPVIGDFWEKVLYNTGHYTGNAMRVHRHLSRREPFTPELFDRWLALWDRTVDHRCEQQRPVGLGRSLEWATSCPPPRHNFTSMPRIRSESPTFDLHHPEVSLAEYETNDADEDESVDAGDDTGRVGEFHARISGGSADVRKDPQRSDLQTQSSRTQMRTACHTSRQKP